jgi:hypothetical protein
VGDGAKKNYGEEEGWEGVFGQEILEESWDGHLGRFLFFAKSDSQYVANGWPKTRMYI